MPKLPIISGKRLLAVFRRRGFIVLRQRGSHVRLATPDGLRKTVIPVHANRDLPRGTLESILEDLNLDVGQLNNLI